MPTNQTRRQLLDRIKTSSFPGSIIDVFKAADQGVDLISQFEQQQHQEQAQQQMQQEQMQQDQGMQVANTPEEQEIGLREQHAMGNTDASMAFPNVQPGQSFNTVGMKAPIDIQKIDSQGHLVESYKNVPPGIQDLPTGPYEGTIIESPSGYQKGGVRKYQKAGPNDPPTNITTNLAPDPVIGNQMGFGMEFECDTKTGANCKTAGRWARLGLKGSLIGQKGAYGQPTNYGPGWDHNTQQQVDNRIGTNYDNDITGNLGAYLRTDLQPLLFPNDRTKLRGTNWEPWHLDLGYNRKQNLFGTDAGTGSNNITAKLAKTRDQKFGSAGWGLWNKGNSDQHGYSYGLQGNYNYDTKRLDNIGAFGRIGMMGPLGFSGHVGYNPQTGKPNFGAGMSMKFKKGGAKNSEYENLIPEIEISALSDKSYNKLSAAQKQVYDSYTNPYTGDFQQYSPFRLSDTSEGYIHWKDAMDMVKGSKVNNIYNKPNESKYTLGNNLVMDENGYFRAHANPNKLDLLSPFLMAAYPQVIPSISQITGHNAYGSGDIHIPAYGSVTPDTEKWTLRGTSDDYRHEVYQTQYMNDLIAELGHLDPSKRPYWSLLTSPFSRAYRAIKEGSITDDSNYGNYYDLEHHTHYGPNSSERGLINKYSKQPFSKIDSEGTYGHIKRKGGLRKYQTAGVNSLGQGTGVDAEGGEISKDNQSALNWFEDYKKGEYFNTMTGNYPSLSFEGQDYTPQALEQIAEFGTKGQNQWNSTKLFQNPSKHGAYYHKGKINMPKGTRSSVLSHELGHTDNNWLSLPFQNWVGDHNLKLQSGAIQEGSHDARAYETRGDLTRLRYMMENANIFNSTGDFKTFTAEDYDKAYGQFGKLGNTDSRIFRMYSKEDVIWLMNNMANKTPQGGNPFEISDDLGGESQYMVKKGGLRKLNKRRRWL